MAYYVGVETATMPALVRTFEESLQAELYAKNTMRLFAAKSDARKSTNGLEDALNALESIDDMIDRLQEEGVTFTVWSDDDVS